MTSTSHGIQLHRYDFIVNTIPISLAELNLRFVKLIFGDWCQNRPTKVDVRFVVHVLRLHRKVAAESDDNELALHIPANANIFRSLVCRLYIDCLISIEQRLLERLRQLNLCKHIIIIRICRRRLLFGKQIAAHLRRIQLLRIQQQKLADDLQTKVDRIWNSSYVKDQFLYWKEKGR